MGHGEVLLVDVDLAREDDGILPAPRGLFLVLRRLENVAPPGVEGSPVWHALLLWISGGRRRGSIARPDPRGAGHVKSILDANPISQGHYTPKPKCARGSPTPCTRVIKFYKRKSVRAYVMKALGYN